MKKTKTKTIAAEKKTVFNRYFDELKKKFMLKKIEIILYH